MHHFKFYKTLFLYLVPIFLKKVKLAIIKVELEAQVRSRAQLH